uniref:Uncharacterized protein n=1 Tax=Oryza glumipatula TaxID=40148 RepID=A0A0D9ZB34_9ORYZ
MNSNQFTPPLIARHLLFVLLHQESPTREIQSNPLACIFCCCVRAEISFGFVGGSLRSEMTSPATTYASPFVLSVLLLVSIPVIFLLAPRLLPPKTLPAIPDADESDDLALFRRAILSSSSPSSATPTPSSAASYFFRRRPAPKVAFLFLTNSDLVFSPLWEKFFRGHHHLFNLYVHADPFSALTMPPTPSFRGRFVPAKATQRASPTLISAARRLIATALLDDPSNQFFALLSQSCIPLHPFPTLYNALLSDNAGPHGRHRSFIEIMDDAYMIHDRYYARGDDVMLPEVPYDQFRFGSQFFVLTRKHAIMVVRDMKLWRKFKLPCLIKRRDSCYPEEHYFPTLLDMQDPEGCTGYTLTRVNWTDQVEGHPHTYRPGEVSASLIKELRKSNGTYSYMFARKFAPECLEPLMEIADSVILQAGGSFAVAEHMFLCHFLNQGCDVMNKHRVSIYALELLREEQHIPSVLLFRDFPAIECAAGR